MEIKEPLRQTGHIMKHTLKCGVLFLGVLLFFNLSIEGKASTQSMLLTPEMKGAEYVGTETCASCHVKQYSEFKLSTHSRIATSEEIEGVAQGCEMCHGPGSVHVENGGGRGTMINPRKKPEVCFTCHLDKKAEFRLPYRHPVLEGKMSCSDCHNIHGVDARPWTATSMQDVNEACFKCHKDKRGPFPWEHDALRDGCTACHRPHGAITDKMLIARDSNLCLRCHIQSDFPVIGNRSGHAGNLPESTCWSAGCHTAPHGSYFDEHFRE
jgi:predicted CXXCH cytochrome family protein